MERIKDSWKEMDTSRVYFILKMMLFYSVHHRVTPNLRRMLSPSEGSHFMIIAQFQTLNKLSVCGLFHISNRTLQHCIVKCCDVSGCITQFVALMC